MGVIYHGTPLTPRAALLNVCAGRAMCVSFYRPDDVEAVEEISPAIMYDNGAFSFWQQALREGKEWAEDRDWTPFLSLAGAPHISSRALGRHSRYAGCAVPAQRRTAERLAFRAERRTALAHGRIDRSACPTVRAIPARLRRMDRRSEEGAGRLSSLSPQDGRGYSPDGQCMAPTAHASGNGSGLRLSLYQRRQHQPRAERVEIRQPHGHNLRGQMARTMCLCRPVGRETR